jgi:hypothetical protein
LCHAALIYAKAGDSTSAKDCLKQALTNNPIISAELIAETKNALQSLM